MKKRFRRLLSKQAFGSVFTENVGASPLPKNCLFVLHCYSIFRPHLIPRNHGATV